MKYITRDTGRALPHDPAQFVGVFENPRFVGHFIEWEGAAEPMTKGARYRMQDVFFNELRTPSPWRVYRGEQLDTWAGCIM